MCGIIAAITTRNVVPTLIEGLKRLEYRGYDSAGFSIVRENGDLYRQRVIGNIEKLLEKIGATPSKGSIGIAHTRWATHGIPSLANAHPHVWENRVSLVHNGIVENHQLLRNQLKKKGYHFNADSDSEVLLLEICDALKKTTSLSAAVATTLPKIEGSYAIAAFDYHASDRLILAKKGSPLVIGISDHGHYVASDLLALLGVVEKFVVLEDGDIAELRHDGYAIRDQHGNTVKRPLTYPAQRAYDACQKGSFRHHMIKEIYEQPKAIQDTLHGYLKNRQLNISAFDNVLLDQIKRARAVQIVACGTSYHAAREACLWIEEIARLPARSDIASEFRYRNVVLHPDTLLIVISQSGETADTLAVLKIAKEIGFFGTLAICNVPQSSITRIADTVLITKAGIEIAVASTKAFTTQLTALLLLVLLMAKVKDVLGQEREKELVTALMQLPRQIAKILNLDKTVLALSEELLHCQNVLYLGRGSMLPIAMEGALKLKEISYIHAEAYAAGELKHGPLALIDQGTPIIAVAPNDLLRAKLHSNLEEVRARGGKLYVISDHDALIPSSERIRLIRVPSVHQVTAPIVYTIPLQLMAYHIASEKGVDVDQPRNLAKSVTVE